MPCSPGSAESRHSCADGRRQVLYDFDFDWRYMVRGLTIDKRRGNVLKLDRHKYVKLAYHGFQPLTREQRLATYANSLARASTAPCCHCETCWHIECPPI